MEYQLILKDKYKCVSFVSRIILSLGKNKETSISSLTLPGNLFISPTTLSTRSPPPLLLRYPPALPRPRPLSRARTHMHTHTLTHTLYSLL